MLTKSSECCRNNGPRKVWLISSVTVGLPSIFFHVPCRKFSSVLKISIRSSRSDAMKKRRVSENWPTTDNTSVI